MKTRVLLFLFKFDIFEFILESEHLRWAVLFFIEKYPKELQPDVVLTLSKLNLKQHNSLRSNRCCFVVVLLRKAKTLL